MGTPNDVTACRLCSVKLAKENLKHIFDEKADLVKKINNTLPISISSADDHSKYICLDCHKKIIEHYDFIQKILEHSKDRNNPFFNHRKNKKIETIPTSKLHNDMIYTCPNCNIDLMIIVNSNPESCDYAFQISLAIVDQMEKPLNEKNMQVSDNITDFENSYMKKLNIKDEFNGSLCFVMKNDIQNTNEARENLPILQEAVDCVDSYITLQKADRLHQDVKKEFQENSLHGIHIDRTKLQKIETKSDADLSNCDYGCVDSLIKIESINDADWLSSNMNRADDTNTLYTTEMKKERIDEDNTKYEDTDIKNCPKMCRLCGTSYFSQLKYEFHIERHRLNKTNDYICTVCNKETNSENLLWDHYFHTHRRSMCYSCTECGTLFIKRSRLNSHQKRHKHSGTKEIHFEGDTKEMDVDQDPRKAIEIQKQVSVNCNICGKLITNLDPDGINDLVTCATCEDSTLSLMVDGNETKVISPRQYHCSRCPKHFVRKERLEFHEMRHSENMNEFICSTCGKEFSAENSLYEHYLFVHKGARPHICELCGKSFQLKARLKEHHRTHTGERPYQCDVCGQRCMTTNALKLHRKTHFSHNRYICKICDKSFSKKQNMNEHLEKHWKNDKNVLLPQLFTCPVCSEDLPTYRMLKYHMMEIHRIDRQDPLLMKQKPWYECDECHEKFKHQMSLKAHKEKVHEGKVSPIFQCDICNVTYRIKRLLINHIKSKHDGEKRYKCAQCEKGFNDTKSLYNHVLLHTGKKPFVCEYCNMSFRRKDSRDHHRRKHTGERPYQCPDCSQRFSTYNNRSKHRRKEHADRELECPVCREKCNGQQEIRIHLNKHLGERLNELQCV